MGGGLLLAPEALVLNLVTVGMLISFARTNIRPRRQSRDQKTQPERRAHWAGCQGSDTPGLRGRAGNPFTTGNPRKTLSVRAVVGTAR